MMCATADARRCGEARYCCNVYLSVYSPSYVQHFLYPPARFILGASLGWIIIFLFVANETETHREGFSHLPEITG